CGEGADDAFSRASCCGCAEVPSACCAKAAVVASEPASARMQPTKTDFIWPPGKNVRRTHLRATFRAGLILGLLHQTRLWNTSRKRALRRITSQPTIVLTKLNSVSGCLSEFQGS